MRIVILVLALLASACGDMLTAPSTPKTPYTSLYNPQPTPRNTSACYDYGRGYIVCPVQ